MTKAEQKPSGHASYDWATVAVIALPTGWQNVMHNNGIVSTQPCPALLLQELRQTQESYRDPTNGLPTFARTVHNPPFKTRVIAGAFQDQHSWRPGEFDSVDSAFQHRYICTIAPGEDVSESMRQEAKHAAEMSDRDTQRTAHTVADAKFWVE